MNRKIVQKVDDVALAMEKKYGYNSRMLDLVPKDLEVKFTKALQQFNEAIGRNDATAMDRYGEALIRGYQALDKIAEKSVHSVWKVRHTSGTLVTVYQGAIPRTPSDGSICMSIEEILKFVPASIVKVKEHFPKSKVLKTKDEVPF